MIKTFKRWTFRKKVFFTQSGIFLFFMLVMFPVGRKAVHQIVKNSLEETSADLIIELKKQKNEAGMIDYLKNQDPFVFFNVGLINDKHELIYDVYLVKQLKEEFEPLHPTSHVEVTEAFAKGKGYDIGWSEIFDRKLAYVAIRFDFKDKVYVLRTAFPYSQVEILVSNFQLGMFTFEVLFLVVFTLITWWIFVRFSRPIQEIIEAIRPYREGSVSTVPRIMLKYPFSTDFKQLASTLNSLSEKVQRQIESVLEEKNEKETILETLGEGVIAVDKTGIVRYLNLTASKMLGISPKQLLGVSFLEHAETPRFDLLKKCQALLSIAQEEGSIAMDSIFFEEAQKKQYLDLIVATKKDGLGAVIVLQDKTNHYKVLEMGKEFVANASHELRTPITIIKGFAETLQEMSDIPPELFADILEKIVRNCERMDMLVKNFLTLADIENLSESRFQASDLEKVISNCKETLLSLHPGVKLEVRSLKGKITVPIDPDLIEMALMNILANAVKYSPPPAHIILEVQEKESNVEIKISDRGIGIAELDQEHIFERFYTVNKSHTRKLGGAGLGLSIVKTIIQKHQGSIGVTSVLGKGTTFTIVLPKTRLSA